MILKIYAPDSCKLESLARRCPEFELGLAGAEAAKLKKFSDVGKIKVSGCPTTPKLQLSSGSSISQRT